MALSLGKNAGTLERDDLIFDKGNKDKKF